MLVETIRISCAGVFSLSEEYTVSILLEAEMRKTNTDNSHKHEISLLYVGTAGKVSFSPLPFQRTQVSLLEPQ